MIRYLLDTNVVSEPVKSSPNASVLKRLEQLGTELAISSVTWHELLFGVGRMPDGRKRDYLTAYLNTIVVPAMPILPYDKTAAQWHASERVRLEKMGTTGSFADGQVAAIAATNELVLVTRNVKDFVAFQGIEVENWFFE
jgi:tRNA(fMet)-specific endonuclease VapC